MYLDWVDDHLLLSYERDQGRMIDLQDHMIYMS